MNLAQFVKTLSDASARTAEKTSTKSPFKFYNLRPKQQEKVVRSANYKLGRDPRTFNFDLKDKELLNAIQERMNNYSFMNNLKNGKQIEGYSSILDKKADDFLAANSDKISKDLEEYSTIPLDYEEKSSKVDLSKFTDDEDNVLDQSEALDNLLYNEGIESLNSQPKNKTDMEQTLLDAIRVKNFGNRRIESKWLEKQLQNFADDAAVRDPSTLPHYTYIIKDATKNLDDYDEVINAPTRLTALRQMYKNYHNIDNTPVESPWKHLKQPENQTRFPPKNPIYKDIYKPVIVKGKYSTFTLPPQPTTYKIAPEETSINLPYNKYSNKAKNTSFDPVQQELTQPLDSLPKDIRDELNRIPNRTKNQRDIEKALYNMTDEEDRLYNTKNLPGLETEIDPYTGYTKDSIYKYADEPHYSKSGNIIEYLDENDIINNKIDEGIYTNNEKLSDFTDNQRIDNIINASNRNIEQTKTQNRALNAAIYDWYRENMSKPKNMRKKFIDLSKYIEDNSF